MNRTSVLVVALVGAMLLASCGSDGPQPGAESPSDGVAASSTTTTVDDRPAGSAAALTPLATDGEVFIGSPEPHVPDPGYVQEEFSAAGTATSYVVVGEITGDGEWTLETGEQAEYRTRIVVRRPAAAEDFSGTVVVEWLNVSGGVDADPGWTSIHEEVVRRGHAWVGVSAQLVGIEGGPVAVEVGDVPGAEAAGKGLKGVDAERYGTLFHPGDAFANDIFTQTTRAVRSGDALGDLVPTAVVAAGESQSAFALVTYVNGVQPLTEAFDGFFLHSRGASGFPVPSPSDGLSDIASSIAGTPTTIRSDLGVPVFTVQAENDVVGIFGSHRSRQPDSDVFRLWEIAGTAHADRHLMGERTAEVVDCGAPINDGPMHLVVKAAFRHFVGWVVAGTSPPESGVLELTEGDPVTLERDADGIAVGGVRTPPVEVPAQILSSETGPSGDVICLLSGSTTPMAADRLAELYSSREDYEQQYQDAVDVAVEGGVLLEDDRTAIDGYAQADLVAP